MTIQLFLDVDGVVNAYGRLPTSENLWPNSYKEGTAWDYTIAWSPDMVEELRKLNLDHIWLTAWRENAPKFIAPLIGFGQNVPHMPFQRIGNTTIHGKVNAVRVWRAANPHIPFVHIDDEFSWHPAVAEVITELGGLALGTDPEHGITPEDILTIRAYIDANSLTHRYLTGDEPTLLAMHNSFSESELTE